ncbi:MAG: hypothetical protein V4702_01095 [Patescibacteria group bacterium]
MDREHQSTRPGRVVDSFSAYSRRSKPEARPRPSMSPPPPAQAPKTDDPSDFWLPDTPPKAIHKTVSVEIKLPKPRLPHLPYRQYTKAISVITAILIVVIGAYGGVSKLMDSRSDRKVANGIINESKPAFTPVVPLDKPELANPGEGSVAYDADKQVLSYSDTYIGDDFTVSQQPLPEDLKNNPEALGEYASSLGVTRVVETHHGPILIASLPDKTNQTAVFATDKLLIIINTPNKVGDGDWKEYINKLKLS